MNAIEKNRPSGLTRTIEEYARQPGNCAQVTLLALQRHCSLDAGPALRAMAMYPCGTVSSGSICGAVAGSLMALGLVFGKAPFSDPQAMYENMATSSAYCRKIKDALGGITCRQIRKSEDFHSVDIEATAPDQWRRLHIDHMLRCARVMEVSAEIAAEMIMADSDKPPAA